MTGILRTAYVNVMPNTEGFGAELTKRLKAIDASKEGARAGQGFGSKFAASAGDTVRKGFGAGLGAIGLGAGIGTALATGIKGALDVGAANDKLRAQLNLNKTESAKLGQAAGQLYSKGYGDSMGEVNDALKSVIQNIPSLRNASVPVLKEISAGALDIARVFDQDVGGVTAAVSSMLKTGLAPNAKAAMDILTKGFQSGADKGGDLLDTFTEYSNQFAKLGLSAPQSLGIINQLLAGGARNADVAADAVKEFAIRSIDGSKTTIAGYKALNLNASQFSQVLAKGGPEATKAFGTIVEKINSIQDPVKRNAAGVAFFGTKFEDLGVAFKHLDVSAATDGLGQVAGATKNIANQSDSARITAFMRTIQGGFTSVFGSAVAAVNAFVAANRDKLQAALQAVSNIAKNVLLPAFQGIASTLVNTLLPAIGKTVGFLSNHTTALKVAGIAAAAFFAIYKAGSAIIAVQAAGGLLKYLQATKLVTAATKIWTGIQVVFNAVMTANPIAIAVLAIGALVAAVVIAYKKSDAFRAIVQSAWAAIKTAISAVAGWFTGTIVPSLKKAYDVVSNAALWLWKNAIKPAWDGIKTAIDVAWKVIKIILDALKAYFEKVIAPVVKWLYNNIFKPMFEAIGFIVKAAWVIIQIALAAMKLYFEKVIAPVVKWLYNNVFSPIFKAIGVAVKAAWVVIQIALAALKLFFEKVIAPVVRWLYTNVFKPMFDAMGLVVKTVWNNVIKPTWNALKTAFDAVGKALKAVWDNVVKPMFNAFGDFLKKYVAPAFTKGVDAIKAAWDKIKDKAKEPIVFVINKVINPLIGGINSAASFLGVKDRIPTIPPLAKGGLVADAYARGGQLPGSPVFGRDNMLGMGPQGPIALGSGEFVTNTKSTLANLGLVSAINKKQGKVGLGDVLPHLDGYADGGVVGAIGGFFKKAINGAKGIGKAFLDPGGALADVANKILGSIPGGGVLKDTVVGGAKRVIDSAKSWISSRLLPPSPPSGGQTYPWIVQMAQQLVPGIKAISTFRQGATTLSGNRSYHAIGQAVDFPANHDLAQRWHDRFGKITNELITPWNNLNMWNGKSHQYTGAVWNQHNFAGGNAHDHIAVSGSLGGPLPGGSLPTGSLAGWIARGLSLTGTSSSWTSGLNTLIKRESGGNPNAINRTDSNARAGHPSQGLMQLIPSTFSAYRLSSLANNILDPIANIAAGIRYIKSRYGDISKVQQANPNLPPKGYSQGGLLPFGSYDSGGFLPKGLSLAHNGTGRPEPVGHGLNDEAVDLLKQILAAQQGTGTDVAAALQSTQRSTYQRARTLGTGARA